MEMVASQKQPLIPTISVSRRCSVSTPLRFTRTFSSDSLDSIEKQGLKELRRQLMINQISHEMGHPTGLPCPHLCQIQRADTDPVQHTLRIRPPMKRSTGDLPRDISPSKKTLMEMIGISPYQLKLINQSWPNIYSTGPNGQFASSIYSKLCNKNAKARQLFAKANGCAVFSQSEDATTLHARVTVELIDSIVRNLDQDHNRITNYIDEVGRAHRHLKSEGLGPPVWDELGDAIVDCVRRFDAVRKHKELRRAWLAITAYMVDTIKQGHSITRTSSSYELSSDKNGSPHKVSPNS